MKKRYFIYFIILSVFSIITGFKKSLYNSFRIKIMAGADVIINFRGLANTVSAGSSTSINDISQGTYDYTTTYAFNCGSCNKQATIKSP